MALITGYQYHRTTGTYQNYGCRVVFYITGMPLQCKTDMIHNWRICKPKIENEKPCSPAYFDKAMVLVGRWRRMMDEYAINRLILFLVLITE